MTDDDGHCPICVIAAIAEVGGTALDVVVTIKTLRDPNASTTEKVVTTLGTAGGMMVPGVGGTGTLAKGIFRRLAKAKQALKKADDVAVDTAKAVHKNSLDYVGDSHVYKVKAPDGTVHKVGESSKGTRKRDGAPKRAESQVRKRNREVGPGHESKIIRRTAGKRESRDHEQKLIKRYRRRFGENTVPGNKGNH